MKIKIGTRVYVKSWDLFGVVTQIIESNTVLFKDAPAALGARIGSDTATVRALVRFDPDRWQGEPQWVSLFDCFTGSETLPNMKRTT